MLIIASLQSIAIVNEPISQNPAQILRLIVVAGFLLMNVLYLLFWKNGKADYYDSLPEEKKKLLATRRKMEFAPRVQRPHCCQCGYDLRVSPQSWERNDSYLPRCPDCGRTIYVEEFDLTGGVLAAALCDEDDSEDQPSEQSICADSDPAEARPTHSAGNGK